MRKIIVNCNMHSAVVSCWGGAALAIVTAVAMTWLPVGAQPPDPTDSGANTTAETPSFLPPSAGDYLKRVDQPRLPWPKLFERDGSFVPESALDPSASPSSQSAPAPSAQMSKPDATNSTSAGDSRGVIRKVNASAGKVTIKHGPIQKLDMPGMTMTFRAKDPALLEGLKPGEEVEFDVAMEGSKFFITRIKK